jgi:hypothetical protein
MLALALTSLALVGPVDDSRAFAAVQIDGSRVRAYVCDGTSRRSATLSQWFRGRWDRRAPITLRAGGRTLRLRPPGADGRISGRLIQDGTSNTFTLKPASGPAGLYDVRRGETRATWVMLADRRLRGAMVDPRPRKCRPVQMTLADGTSQVVTVCKMG